MSITLKAARVNAGLGLAEAAEKLGISVSTLIYYEKGERFPNVPTIQRIEKLYGVEYKDIIFLPRTTI